MVKAAVAAIAGLAAVLVLFVALIGATLGQLLTTPTTTGTGPAPTPALAAALDIPADYLALYVAAAATCPGLDWSVPAAVGAVESDHGRSRLPGVTSGENSAGAQGPMQFLPATFAEVTTASPPPPGGAMPPSPYVAHDAIHAAASYLCTSGAGRGDVRAALVTYNHSDAYVEQVLTRAAAYRDTTQRANPPTTPAQGADDVGQAASVPGAGGPTVTRWPAEQANVPDPSGTGGQVTPRLAALYRALDDRGSTRGASCVGNRPDNPNSDHPHGRACDIPINPNDPADVARGWDIAHWLTTHQPTYGIRYIIWQGRIWTATQPVWETYESSAYDCPNPANITGCHLDHLHISVY